LTLPISQKWFKATLFGLMSYSATYGNIRISIARLSILLAIHGELSDLMRGAPEVAGVLGLTVTGLVGIIESQLIELANEL